MTRLCCKRGRSNLLSSLVAVGIQLALLLSSARVEARPQYLSRLPNTAGCSNCHNNINGGPGCSLPPCLNPFGMAFDAAGRVWSPTLAARDTDGDGCSNGEEIGDADGDGVLDTADFCARSPGLDADSSPNECARRDEFCCDAVGRARLACECGEAQDDTPICLPPPEDFYLPNDVAANPTALLDGTWTPVDASFATSSEPPASCGADERDLWFEAFPDCVSGTMVVELTHPADIAIYSEDGEPRRELYCHENVTHIELPAERLLIRVAGVESTSLRVTCEPDASRDAAGSVCSNAEPIVDGLTVLDLPNGRRGGLTTLPHDPCASDVEHDLWFEYEATCTGRVTVAAQFGQESIELGDCLDSSTTAGVLGVYSTLTNCPEREHPISCLEQETPVCVLADPVSADFPATLGERFYLRVGRTPPVFFQELQAQLRISCEEAPIECSEYCAAHADCEVLDDVVDCNCTSLYAGDGNNTLRGGSGCELSVPCTDTGLSCSPNGACVPDEMGFACYCDEGYALIGGRCQPDPNNDCSPARAERPAGAGYVECLLGRLHTVCVPEGIGYHCACERGHSAIPGRGDLECQVLCGDGIRGPGEECDDGNHLSGDGCNRLCQEEDFWNCYEPTGSRSRCFETCGDGLIDLPFEQCDDGNTDPGDGCSATCQRERPRACAARFGRDGDAGAPLWVLGALGAAALWRARRRRRARARR